MLLIKLKKALPYVVALGFILGIAATLDYARSKRVKPPESFLAKVQLAESESKKIEFDKFITSDTIYKDKSRFGFPIVCSSGSYQTQTSSGDGVWCKKGFSKYYGLSRVDETSFESLYSYLLNNGWQPFDESGSLDNLKRAVLSLNDRVGSVYFKNQDDLTAMLSVARTDMKRNGSLCTSTLCQLAETKKDFAAVAEISIFYEIRPF